MMMKGFVFVIFFLCLLGCAHREATRSKLVLQDLPRQWQAKGGHVPAGCATPRPVGAQWWAFCDGEGAHGRLLRWNAHKRPLGELRIASQDRLALLRSVSSETAWLAHQGLVWVGTEDGRLLVFDSNGQWRDTLQLPGGAWVQEVLPLEDGVALLTGHGHGIQLMKINRDATLHSTVAVGSKDAEAILGADALYVSTIDGLLLCYDHALNLLHSWRLDASALGRPLWHQGELWVGSGTGRLHHVSPTGEARVHVMGKGPISLAPIATSEGVWVALEEEGKLKLLRPDGRQETRRVPFNRSLMSFRSVDYAGHQLLSTTAPGHFTLLSDSGEVLLKLSGYQGGELETAGNETLWVGGWELSPLERSPASR